jgi:hypothetical protein
MLYLREFNDAEKLARHVRFMSTLSLLHGTHISASDLTRAKPKMSFGQLDTLQ